METAPVRIALALAVALAGCGIEDTEPLTAPDSGVPATDTGPAGQIQPPTPDPVPSSVCTDTVALQGTAAPGASVIVFGGSTSALSTDANPLTGRFCMDVLLVKDSSNSLQLRAQDPTLGMSDAVTVTVAHSSNCTDDATKPPVEQPKSKNVAIGAPGTSKDSAEEGNAGFLTDGDSATFVRYAKVCHWYSSPTCHFEDYNGWVYITLDKLYEVDKIVVRWKDSDGDFGKEYKILVSSMSAPGDPDLKNGYWTEVATIKDGDGDEDSFDLKSGKILAQHVALWLQNDGATSSSENFSIAELEVWDVPQGSSSTTLPDLTTCSAIGSGQ